MSEGEKLLPLRKAKTWSKVRIEKLGLLDTNPRDVDYIGKEVVVFGMKRPAGKYVLDPENGKPIRTTVVYFDNDVWQFGGDTIVRETVPRAPAGHPKEIAKLAIDGTQVSLASEGFVQFQNETPNFIWEQSLLDSAVGGTCDAEHAVEILLYAISVAPDEVLPILYASLAQQYDQTMRYYKNSKQESPKWNSSGVKRPRA